MWWWSNYGPTPWMFLGPLMMFVFMAIFMIGMFLLMRVMWRNKSQAAGAGGMNVCGIGVWPSGHSDNRKDKMPDSGSFAFAEYRADTLQRLDQEQREFQDFITRLRTAKDKAEFEQFMADRRNRTFSLQA